MLLSYKHKNIQEVGCDEAGRGCLAGPVFAAAVILPNDFKCEMLNDSKKIAEKNRYKLKKIIETNAIAWAVASVDNQEIDKINILNASILAMHKAIDKLPFKPDFILVDGNKFKKYQHIPHECVVKGDGKYASIAAASILAKTHRDDFVKEIHKKYPQYGWDKNKAYPTKQHRIAIVKFGITPYHRKSYKLIDYQTTLNL